MFDCTLPGTGALQPLPERNLATGALTCQGRTLLFDCGEGTQAALRKNGISLAKIDCIALTHYHGDHIFGLPGLLQSIGMMSRTEPLLIMGPEGLAQIIKIFRCVCPFLPYEIRLLEAPNSAIKLRDINTAWPDGATLEPFPTEHKGVFSCGYRFSLHRPGKFDPAKAKALRIPVVDWKRLQYGESIETEGKVIHPEDVLGPARRGLCVCYTGDTAYFPELAEYVWEADLLISDATYAENEQQETAQEHGHMTFADAANLAKNAQVAKLWLTHYSPMIKDPGEFLCNAQEIFPETICGFDGMTEHFSYQEGSDNGK